MGVNIGPWPVARHRGPAQQRGAVRRRTLRHVLMYRLGTGPVLEVLAAFRRLAEHNVAEVREIVANCFTRLDSLEAVSREELSQRPQESSVTVLDVRSEDEFALGQLPGAVNIPLAGLERRLADLSSNHGVAAYRRGLYCVLSFEAVAEFRRHVYRVCRPKDGYPE